MLNIKLVDSYVLALDCYNFGVHAHDAMDYYHSIIWMEEAYERLQHEEKPTVAANTILDYLAFASYNVSEPVIG